MMSGIGRFFANYSWLIVKNVIGWALLLLAFVIGPLIPGPGGIPLFLIGFALVTRTEPRASPTPAAGMAEGVAMGN